MRTFRGPRSVFLVLAGGLALAAGASAQDARPAAATPALEAQHVLGGHGGTVTAAKWSPDGTQVATACTDGVVRLWDAGSGKLRRELRGHGGVVWDLDWTTDGTRLISGGKDGTGRIWDAGGGDQLHVLPHGRPGAVLQVRVINEHIAVMHGGHATPQVWRIADGRKAGDLVGHTDVVWAMDVAQQRWLVTGSQDRTVRLWDLQTGKLVRAFGEAKDHPKDHPNLGPGSPVLCVAISDDGQVISAGHRDGRVIQWKADGTKLHEFGTPKRGPVVMRGAVTPSGACVALRAIPGKRTVLAGYAAGTLQLHPPKVPGPVFPTHAGWVQQLAVAPGGTQIASGGWDGKLVYQENPPARPQHSSRITALSFAPDGKRLLSASGDKTARIWKLP